MLKKAVFFAYAMVSLVSFSGYAVEDESSEDTILTCKDCILACSCEDADEKNCNG